MKAWLRPNANFPFKAAASVSVALGEWTQFSPACSQNYLRSLSTPVFSNPPSRSFSGSLRSGDLKIYIECESAAQLFIG